MSTSPARALIVETDGTLTLRTITPDLPTLQAIVGGPIEAVSMLPEWIAYCDEEGKIAGKSLNTVATRLAVTLGWAAQDVLVGPVLFLGIDEEGAEIDVPRSVVVAAEGLGEIERV